MVNVSGSGISRNSPYGPHPRHDLQLVHVAHRLHRLRHPNPRFKLLLQSGYVCGLAPYDPPVVAEKERYKLYAGLCDSPYDFSAIHVVTTMLSFTRPVCRRILVNVQGFQSRNYLALAWNE